MATRRLARFFAATLLSVCLAGTIVTGAADFCRRSDSETLVRLGLRLTPGDAEGWMRLSNKATGVESRAALEEAARLNSHNSAVRIELGLRAEAAGDLDGARRYFARAIEMDRGYLPLWTAANFAIRHNDPHYAPLLHRAFQVALAGAQDPIAVFDLAWQVSGDAAFILKDVVAEEPAALRVYVPYLVGSERKEALVAPALALAAARNPDDRAVLLSACELLLEQGRESDALTVWNGTGISTLDPERGNVVTNGVLAAPVPLGFDWKFNSSPEHSIDFQGSEVGAKIELSGRQPDTVDLLRQTIPVSAGQRYTLRWRAKAESGMKQASLVWVLTPLHSDAPFARVEVAMKGGEARITVPADVRFASLALRLERRLGETRYSGGVWVGKVEMRHAQ